MNVAELSHALSVRDLTDPAQGPHAIQQVVDLIRAALPAGSRVVRTHPIVPVEDNYEKLGYAADAVTRDARYTRYVSETCMLRSHTSAAIPPTLRALALEPGWSDMLLLVPGIVYRRDSVDRIHTGTPHQLDVWHVSRLRELGVSDLVLMIDAVVQAVLPGAVYRTTPAVHPYTSAGRQVDVLVDGEWIEIAECGLAARHVLDRSGLPRTVTGLAMGMGLDRLVMLRKRIPDIRLLSATDPRIARQMLDLTPYRPVSKHPPISRDVSVAVSAAADAETIGDAVRAASSAVIEEVRILSETPVEDLPPVAVERLGARPGQKNVLLRIVLRDHLRTLSDQEANAVRNAVYAAVHEGDSLDGIAGRPLSG